VATGIGSLPGTDIVEACKIVFGELASQTSGTVRELASQTSGTARELASQTSGTAGELPGLPHLPELPERGPGADIIGRGAGLLTSLPVELYIGQWRIAARPGRELRRTRDLMERDLDALTEAAQGYAGPLKLQAAGPWTLAANVDLPIGGRLLHDHGAVADLVSSLADGLRAHVADVTRRLPHVSVVLQLDEPSVPAVLTGAVPTESGLRTLRSVAASTVESALRDIVDTVAVPVILHCCADNPPLRLFRDAGAAAVSIDLTRSGASSARLDELGELMDAGVGLLAGAVPTAGTRAPSAVTVADTVLDLWRRLGFPIEQAAAQVVVTPACGLAGATPTYARAALTTCVEAARRLDG
jgi:methionine synthase II (cobalamin-independent)